MASIFLVNTVGGLGLADKGCHKILENSGVSGMDYFIVRADKFEKTEKDNIDTPKTKSPAPR